MGITVESETCKSISMGSGYIVGGSRTLRLKTLDSSKDIFHSILNFRIITLRYINVYTVGHAFHIQFGCTSLITPIQ